MYKEAENIRSETRFVNAVETVSLGVGKIKRQPIRLIVLAIIVLSEIVICLTRCNAETDVANDPLAPLVQIASVIEAVLISSLTVVIYVYVSGRPPLALWTEHCLRRAGVVNKAGETPRLIRREHRRRPLQCLIFRSRGISLDLWLERQSTVETALNITIADIRYGKGAHEIVLYYVPATGGLPSYLPWDKNIINNTDQKLVVGVSAFGQETVDLNVTPHVLIGGSTGSGKTVLMKALLYQCLCRYYQVYVVDFKGGLDYSKTVWGTLQVYTNYDETLCLLQGLLNILSSRIQALKETGCKNTMEYNREHARGLPCIVLFCDELAEMTDKTGASKEDKAAIDELIKSLSTIARLGRAAGIHLILGTQRPDANVLPGQIKNNVDYRICGRADDVLSRIVLDNDLAASLPKTLQGRFVNTDGHEIQAYYFTDDDVIL